MGANFAKPYNIPKFNSSMLIRKAFKKILFPILLLWWKYYTRFSHTYRYNSLNLTLLPSVFHPAIFLSTKVFIEYISSKDLQNKKVWELGAGSGLIAFSCAQQGAEVLATDINLTAVEGLKKNTVKNNLQEKVRVLYSDLFENVPVESFDFILINPPYYPSNPGNEGEMAFYCGENFEYFIRLFKGIGEYIHPHSCVLMILSEDCKANTISQIAGESGWEVKEVFRKKVKGEWNMIYQIIRG